MLCWPASTGSATNSTVPVSLVGSCSSRQKTVRPCFVVMALIVRADELHALRQVGHQFHPLRGRRAGVRDRELIGRFAFQIAFFRAFQGDVEFRRHDLQLQAVFGPQIAVRPNREQIRDRAAAAATSCRSSFLLSPGRNAPISYSNSLPAGCCRPAGKCSSKTTPVATPLPGFVTVSRG